LTAFEGCGYGRCMANRDPAKISRRQSIKLGSGLIFLGAGIGVSLVPTSAQASEEASIELRFYRLSGDGKKKLLGAVAVPPDVADAIAEADDEAPLKLLFRKEVKGEAPKELVAHELTHVVQVRQGIRKARGKKPKPPRKRKR
jgi:hypothetical protein